VEYHETKPLLPAIHGVDVHVMVNYIEAGLASASAIDVPSMACTASLFATQIHVVINTQPLCQS